MILARGDRGDDQMLLIGLSHENIKRLLNAQPILITRETHGEAIPELWTVVVMCGKTENDIAAMLKKHGMLNGTKIHKQPDNDS